MSYDKKNTWPSLHIRCKAIPYYNIPCHAMPCSFLSTYIHIFLLLPFFSFPFFDIIANVFLPISFKTQERIRHIYVNSKVKDGKKHKRKLLWIWSMSALIHVFAYFLFAYSHAHFFLLFAVIPWMLFTLLRLKDEKNGKQTNGWTENGLRANE